MIPRIVKKITDVVLSAFLLAVLILFFLAVAVIIKLTSPGPALFRQERGGQHGKPFLMCKFRSMVNEAERIEKTLGQVSLAENDPKITGIGKFLRRWTIDEWPQLLNVLKGEMSLVGPRPVPLSQIVHYNEFQKRRLAMKPGMVSLVDIKGRNLVPWDKRFEYDAWYVEHWSLWLDFKILFSLPMIILSHKGVYGEGGMNEPPK